MKDSPTCFPLPVMVKKVGEYELYNRPHPVFSIVGLRKVRLLDVGVDDVMIILKARDGQKCFVCRRTVLMPRQNCYEIMMSVYNKKYKCWQQRHVLVCDHCLESKPELADAEVLSFGDGVRIINFLPSSDKNLKHSAPSSTSWMCGGNYDDLE